MLKILHPLRAKRYFCSDFNPMFWPLSFVTQKIEEQRAPVSEDNPFLKMEQIISGAIVDKLNLWRDARDIMQEQLFRSIYDSEALRGFLPRHDGDQAPGQACPVTIAGITKEDYKKGGLADALVRLIIIICQADGKFDRKEFAAARKAALGFKDFIPPDQGTKKSIIRRQVRLIDADEKLAIRTLADLVPDLKERKELYKAGVKIAKASKGIDENEKSVLQDIKQALAV
jgi:tellurite resistance protein